MLIRIVKLPAMRVASISAVSTSPEGVAWKKFVAWAKPKEFLENPTNYMIIGGNIPAVEGGFPGPTEENSEYGYEFMVNIGPEVKPEENVRIKEIPAGLYAVTRIKFSEETIVKTWQKLWEWVKTSEDYTFNKKIVKILPMGGFEDLIGPFEGPNFEPSAIQILDLYLPIKEKKR
ncbi:MAG: GyrI-like domain-containing protein [Candidatus Hodarchaeota archaeon]